MSSDDPERATELLDEVRFRAELSALYHQKRERFFELLDKLSKSLSLFAGSAALYKVARKDDLDNIAILMSVSSALALVFSWSERSRRHGELARSFRDLLTKIAAEDGNRLDILSVRKLLSELCSIEAKEPPTLAALAVACHNELVIARNQTDQVHPQSFAVRVSMHFFDLPNTAARVRSGDPRHGRRQYFLGGMALATILLILVSHLDFIL